MTMKTKKTLQHIAAVAVVLLALLVFVVPVSAENVVELEVAETSPSNTLLRPVGSDDPGQTFQQIVGGLEEGDVVILPSGILNVTPSGYIVVNPCFNFVIEGAADGTTVINVINKGSYRFFQLNHRVPLNPENEVTVTFKNLTIDGNNIDGFSCFVVTTAQITLNLENVAIKNFTGDAISAWANAALSDGSYSTKENLAGIVINLKSVETDNNRALIHFDIAPWYDHTSSPESADFKAVVNGYSFVHLNYDETCSFNDKSTGNFVYEDENENLCPLTYTYKSDPTQMILFEGNMRVNDNMDITLDFAEAKIGETYYETFEEAVAAVPAGQTITLLKDVVLENQVTISNSTTIDGGEDVYVITGSELYPALYLKGEDLAVTLKNLVVSGKYAVKVGSPETTLTIDNSGLVGYAAVYLRSYEDDNADGSTVTITDSILIGYNENNAPTNDFGTISVLANNTQISIQNSELNATATGTANQSILRFGADSVSKDYVDAKVSITGNSVLELSGTTANFMSVGTGTPFTGISQQIIGAGVTANFNPSAYIAPGMEVVQPGDKYLVQKYVDRSSSSSSSVKPEEPEQPEQPEEPVVEPETPAAPGEVASSTEVTDGGDVTFETPAGEDGTAPAAADDEVKGVVLPTGTEGTVEFVPVSETPAPAGQEENTKRVFEINVPSYKKGEASVIKFQMTVAEIEADGKTAADVALWHYDEETGEWTKLVTSFIIKDGIVYFEAITNDFSPFAIVYADEPAEELPTDQPEEPTETPASPAPVLAVIAALGAAVVLRRK